MNQLAPEKKGRRLSVLDRNRPNYESWLKREVWSRSQILLLAVGIDPDSELADEFWSADALTLPRRLARHREIRKVHEEFLELNELFNLSLAYGQLRLYELDDFIPSDRAIQYILEKKIHCEAFENATAPGIGRDSGKREVQARVASKSLGTRERTTLLKLIGAMAIKAYRYNPSASRNDAVPDIAKDLELVGAPLDQDTIRDKLREAADVLAELKS